MCQTIHTNGRYTVYKPEIWICRSLCEALVNLAFWCTHLDALTVYIHTRARAHAQHAHTALPLALDDQ